MMSLTFWQASSASLIGFPHKSRREILTFSTKDFKFDCKDIHPNLHHSSFDFSKGSLIKNDFFCNFLSTISHKQQDKRKDQKGRRKECPF